MSRADGDGRSYCGVGVGVFLVCLLSVGVNPASSRADVRVLTGQQAPGTIAGVTFSSFTSAPVIDDTGGVAFGAFISGPGTTSSNNSGIWSDESGLLSLIARAGDLAPGADTSTSFRGLGGGIIPVVNGSGKLMFRSLLTGSTVNNSNNSGIWFENGGVVNLLVRAGDIAPGTGAGVTFGSFSETGRSIVNRNGQTAFQASLTGSGVTLLNGTGIWSGTSGALRLVARAGSQAPDTATGVNYLLLGDPVLNDLGRVAFQASLTGSGVISPGGGPFGPPVNDTGIWSEATGALRLVARAGNQAPGAPAGVLFSSFGDPVINNDGDAAFYAILANANGSGIWRDIGAGPALVTRTGLQAPGTVAGVYFAGFNAPVINDVGRIAFRASLSGNVVTSGAGINSEGIWSDSLGTLAIIARAGDRVPGAAATITFTTGFSNPNLNSSGQSAFWAQFSGGQGIFATDPFGQLVSVARTGDSITVSPGVSRTVTGVALANATTGGTFSPASGGQDGRAAILNDAGQLAFLAGFSGGSQAIIVSDLSSVTIDAATVVNPNLTLDDGGTYSTLGQGTLTVGNTTTGSLSIAGGTSVHAYSATVGQITGSTGSITLTGNSTTLGIDHELVVGALGTGTLTVGSGSHVNVGDRILVGGGSAIRVDGAIGVGLFPVAADGVLQVSGNAVLTGAGTVIGNVKIDGGTIAPGSGVGATTIDGDVAFLGGKYEFQLASALGDPGNDWDLINVLGRAFVSGDTGNPFLISLKPAGTDGSVSGWDYTKNYQWLFLNSNGIVPQGSLNDLFAIDTSSLSPQNGLLPTADNFSVIYVSNGDSLALSYQAVPEPGSLMLAIVGGGAAVWHRRRRRRTTKVYQPHRLDGK